MTKIPPLSFGDESLDPEHKAYLKLATHCLLRALRDYLGSDPREKRFARIWLFNNIPAKKGDIGLTAPFLCQQLGLPYAKLRFILLYRPKEIKALIDTFRCS